MAAEKILFNKATEVLLGVWEDENTPPTESEAINVRFIIADSLTISQDDPDENTIDNELSDDPILTSYSVGAKTVDFNNASLDPEFLTKILGWLELEDGKGYVSPETYVTKYVAIQVKFRENSYIYMPKVSIAPALNFENLKTNVAYGTLSGTALSDKIGSFQLKSGGPARGSMANITEPILKVAAA